MQGSQELVVIWLFGLLLCVHNKRGHPNKRVGWEDFFVYYIKKHRGGWKNSLRLFAGSPQASIRKLSGLYQATVMTVGQSTTNKISLVCNFVLIKITQYAPYSQCYKSAILIRKSKKDQVYTLQSFLALNGCICIEF